MEQISAIRKTESTKTLYRIIITALMAALVYVGNYLQIPIPNGVLLTRIHLGNSMCLLAGLLFGPLCGGLASGLGAGLYDLFSPVYIVSAPYTFVSKLAMGMTAGLLRTDNDKKRVTVAAVVGQLVYIVLYLFKSYITIIILGGTSSEAWAAVGLNALTSAVNAALAVVIAVPLYFLLREALKRTGVFEFIRSGDRTEKRENKYFNPVTACLTVFAVIVTLLYTINLAATNKIKAAEEAKEAAYMERIDALNSDIDALYAELGMERPNNSVDS